MKTNLKYELIKKLVNTDDELLLEQVRALLEGNGIRMWDELNPKIKRSNQRSP